MRAEEIGLDAEQAAIAAGILEQRLDAGLLLAPQGLGAAIMMPLAGKLTDETGPGKIVLGGLTLLASLFGLTVGRRPEIIHETIPAEGPKTPTA